MITDFRHRVARLNDRRILEQHNRSLKALLHCIQRYEFDLRLNKYRFALASLTYFVHVVSTEGHCPDPCTIQAIKNILKQKDPSVMVLSRHVDIV